MDNELTAFQRYLRRIVNSKEKAREIITACEDDDDVSKATLAIVWNELFDQLVRGEMDDLNRTSGIVQKLYGSTNARRALELKVEEFERREAERAEAKAKVQNSFKTAREGGLSDEALQRVEEQLNLL